jgi:hypothetical protein
MKIVAILVLSLIPSIVFARNGNQRYYYPTYYYPTYNRVITQEKYIIPVREVKFPEVKGLRVLEDSEGKQYYELDGKLYLKTNTLSKENVIVDGYGSETTTTKVENDKIIVERTIIK